MLRNDGPRVIEAERPATQTNVRTELARIGRQWSVSITRLVELSAELDQSGEWALDGSPTCAHWIASVLDIEVSTAREWLRVGRELRRLPKTRSALRDGRLSYTKVRSVTRLATAENEGELLDIAERTAPGQLGTALAAWSARNEDEATRNQRHQRDRSLAWRTEPDGMVTASIRMTPEQAALVIAAIDAEVMRGDGRETDPNTDKNATDGEIDASGTRPSHVRWSSLGQQRVDSLVRLIGGGGSEVTTEVILHVRADGCTLHDGTPIGGSIVERIASEASLRVMIHDAESRPINVSGTHRHHTKRQKLVVKERDDVCVDCGGTDFLEYDHVPDFAVTKHTLVEETDLRCSRCHRARHSTAGGGR